MIQQIISMMRKVERYLFTIMGFFVISFCLCTCKNVKTETRTNKQEMAMQTWERQKIDAGIQLDSMLREKDFDHALSFLDTLYVLYPDEPLFYFSEGWVYDIQNDSIRSRACFEKAWNLCDSMVKETNDLGDKLNHAIITQILYGKVAYDQELKNIAQSVDNSEDSAIIMKFQNFVYNKNDFFIHSSSSFQIVKQEIDSSDCDQ